MRHLQPIPDVCDLELVFAPTALPTGRPSVLIEVPHGATRRRHFEATRRRLEGDYPDDLEEFFYVNTDVGSIECARWIARMLTNPEAHPELASFEDGPDPGVPRRSKTSSRRRAAVAGESGSGVVEWGARRVDQVLIVRGLVARTFIDLNRVITPSAAAAEPGGQSAPRAMTPGIPEYVTHPDDIETLRQLHGAYQALAARAYEFVLGAGGPSPTDASALILHTYAPRTVQINRLDGGIVAALRRAYEPEVFETLVRRPAVDLITEASDGSALAPKALAGLIRKNYAEIGIEASENATYRLHHSTLGFVHSVDYSGSVICLEINRERLAETFTPFQEMSISEPKARRMAAPIAAALLREAAG